MKFIKYFSLDIRYGILRQYKKYILFSVLIILAFFEFRSTQISFENYNFSLMDSLLYIYGGMKEFTPTLGEAFKIPYLWLLNHILILFFTLNYMHKDLEGFGQQTIYRSGSRTSWWFSKCLHQFISVISFYLISWLELVVCTLTTGGQISLKITEIMKSITEVGTNILEEPNWDLQLNIIVLPVLFTVSLGLLQMTLCLFIKPVFSYVISGVVCISSAYYLNPVLLGNYAMALRSDELVANGVNMIIGMILLISLGVCSIIVGALKFRRYDILTKG